MDRDKVLEEILAILVDQLGVDPSEVTEEASFTGDLEADSLDLVEVIMGLEDKFGMKIPDEDAELITTVGEAINYVLANSGEPSKAA